jgi:uncharacterized protein
VRPHVYRRALITGASTGIGEAFARQLAARGAHLVLVARSEDRLAAIAAELREAHGVEVEVLPADLTTEAGLVDVEDRLRRADAPVDLLINNAGFGTFGRFSRSDIEREEEQIRLNSLAPVRLTHALLPGLKARGGGGVLNVSSMAAFQPVGRMAAYGATKAFLNSFSEALHEELRSEDIHVTVLCPGFTRTNFQAVAGVEDASSAIPALLWSEAEDVARRGLDAVADGRAVVVPGGANRVGAAISSLSPSAITRRVVHLGMRRGRR